MYSWATGCLYYRRNIKEFFFINNILIFSLLIFNNCRYFLKSGFAVLFLYRSKSLEPFLRHMPTSELMESFATYKNENGNLCLKGK